MLKLTNSNLSLKRDQLKRNQKQTFVRRKSQRQKKKSEKTTRLELFIY